MGVEEVARSGLLPGIPYSEELYVLNMGPKITSQGLLGNTRKGGMGGGGLDYTPQRELNGQDPPKQTQELPWSRGWRVGGGGAGSRGLGLQGR